ncbi:MAG: sulfite exporter TauE/SafE family protein [Rudaea sp.]
MNGSLTLVGALVLGLVASGHCLLMCGGIAGALAVVTGRAANGKPRFDLLVAYQLGRIGSYTLAGASVGAIGATLLQFVARPDIRDDLRVVSGIMMGVVAVSLLVRGRGMDFGIGNRVWKKLAPISRRLLPVNNVAHAFAFGAVWGWMPCGLVYSVLLIAWLSMDPLRSAAIMLLFGLGTLPAVLAGSLGVSRGVRWLGNDNVRSAAAVVLFVMALLTIGGPWLVAHSGLHAMHWLPWECATR